MKIKFQTIKIVFLFMIISGILISCGSSDKKAKLEKLKQQQSELNEEISNLEKEIALEEGSTEVSKTKDVATLTLTPQVFKHYVEVQGRVDGDENITVSSKMAGQISHIYVNEGDEVKAGQLLAQIDNQVVIQGIEELNTQLEFVTNLFEKQSSLWEQKIGTEVQFLTAKNNKEALEKKLATLKEQLEMTKIKSPINGVVDNVDIKIGQTIMPGMPGIRIVNLNNLKAKAEISETYASKVRKGNDVIIFLPDLNKEVSSKIFYTSKVINNTTRTFSAEAHLNEPNEDYRPNMIAVLKVVDYQNDSAIVIPLNYIQQSGTSDYVYVVGNKNGKDVAVLKEVTVGQVYNGKAEITSGLSPNDKLITSGYLDLTNGMLIKYFNGGKEI